MHVQLRWNEPGPDGAVVYLGPSTFTVVSYGEGGMQWHYSKAEVLEGCRVQPLPTLCNDGTQHRVGPWLLVTQALRQYLHRTLAHGPDRWVPPATREQALATVARGWLIFHAGDYTPELEAEWLALGLGEACTSRALGDATRAALALPSPVRA